MSERHGSRPKGHGKITSQIDDERLRRLWADPSLSIMDVCHQIEALQWDVTERARRLGLGPKPGARGKTNERAADPSPEEIERLCLWIQQRHWTEEEREVRWHGNGRQAWCLPVVEVFDEDERRLA